MRVLLVVNTLPSTDISGVGEQVVQLAAGLESVGHQIEILGRGNQGARGPKLLYPFTVLPPFWRLCRSFRPHVVQIHESDGALVGLLVKILQGMQDPSPRLIALQQVSYLEEIRAVRPIRDRGIVLGRPGTTELRFRWLKAPIQSVLGMLSAWLADRVLAPSRQTAREIERDYRISGVAVLPNVTGAGRLPSEEPRDNRAKVPGRLLFVGRLRVRKGVEVLLHALRDLARNHPEVQLRIVGDGEHRSRLEALAGDLGLGERVEFRGACPPSEIPRWMGTAQALVVPSIYEGMPLVILEAMAAGLPVVASRVSGIPEVVGHGETGWLVPPEDVRALAEALTEVLEDPREAHRRGEVARRTVETAATPEEAAALWLNLISG